MEFILTVLSFILKFIFSITMSLLMSIVALVMLYGITIMVEVIEQTEGWEKIKSIFKSRK